jgi:glutamate racemase
MAAGIPVITPHDVYRIIANEHDNIGLIAANCQSVANIERTVVKYNRQAKVIGYGNLHVVETIERDISPEQVIEKHSLVQLCRMMKNDGATIVLLGCTHYSMLYNELRDRTFIKIFEPTDMMIKLLKEPKKRKKFLGF